MTISALEIAAIFKIEDKASGTLTEISKKLTAISDQLKAIVEQSQKTVDKLAGIFAKMDSGIQGQVTEINQIAAAWDRVAIAARTAQTAYTAGAAGAGITGPRIPLGSPGRIPPMRGGGAGIAGLNQHIKIPGPYGNSYVAPGIFGLGGGFAGNALLAGAALGTLGAVEAAEIRHEGYNAIWAGHADEGSMPSQDVISKESDQFRDIVIAQAQANLMPYKDVAALAAQEMRLGSGVDDQGKPFSFDRRLHNLPNLITAAAAESRQKGVSLEDAGVSFIKFAHEMKEYNPDELAKIYPALSYLSTRTDQTPSAILRASGYHLPSNMAIGIDPIQDMVLQISMERAGAINTKSGTWLAAMAKRALPYAPGTHGDHEENEHAELLKQFGLTDATGLPTWFKNGKPDEMEMLRIVHDRLPYLQQKYGAGLADAETKLFGTTGQRAVSLLADPKIFAQVEGMERGARAYNPAGYIEGALKNDPTAQFQKAWLDLQGVLIQIADKALPSITNALRTFDGVLQAIGATITFIDSHVPNWLKSAAGGAVNRAFNPIGSTIEDMRNLASPAAAATATDKAAAEARINKYTKWFSAGVPSSPAPSTVPFLDPFAIPGFDSDKPEKQSYNVVAPPSNPKPITLAATLNIDGAQLAQTIASKLADIYENSPNGASSNDLSHLDLNGGLSGM